MEELIRKLRVALSIHGTAAWVVALLVGGVLLQFLVSVALWALMRDDGMARQHAHDTFLNFVTLPPNFQTLITRPWTLFTYPLFAPRNSDNTLIFYALFSGLFVFMFTKIHQQLLGDAHTLRLAVLSVPITGLLTVAISMLTGLPSGAYVSGIYPLTAALMVSCVCLVPNYPIELVIFGSVRMWIIGLVSLVVMLVSAGSLFMPGGVAIAVSAILGAGHIYLLKNKGIDFPERVFDFFTRRIGGLFGGNGPREQSRMKVKYGGAAPRERVQERVQDRASATRTAAPAPPREDEVAQEVVDELLDKISATGYESLTRQEKELLFRASKQKEDERH